MADPSYIVDGVLTDGEAWVALASSTVAGSDVASITFTSPEDRSSLDWAQFMDLVLIGYSRVTGAEVVRYINILLNADATAGNYVGQKLVGNGTAASAEGPMGGPIWLYPTGSSAGANEFGVSVTHFFDVNSGKFKSSLTQNAVDSDGDGQVLLLSFVWKNQAPITSMVIDGYSTDDIVIGSRFDLFGVLPRMVA